MIRKILFLIAGLTVLGLLIQLIPYGHNHTNPPVNAEPNWDSPETRILAQRACFDCHSNVTRWPWYSNIAPASWLVYRDVTEGRLHINFSDWNRPDEQHVNEFQEVFDKNSMPPGQYLLLHPEAKLSPDEKQKLFDGLMKLKESYRQ
ncbi:MAG TPA: heme-binding domain-containing protein [Anaerolineales bacterium]|nr:heme-binding domain-containing protein [Anaerolineales bacterium]